MIPKPLRQEEIDAGRAQSANIVALQNILMALAMAEQLYIDALRQERGLDECWTIVHWEKGFEVSNGQ